MGRRFVTDGLNAISFLGGYKNRFVICGVKKSAPCADVNGDIIDGRDRFTCGDDLLIPSDLFRFKDHDTGDLNVQLSASSLPAGPPAMHPLTRPAPPG